MGIRGKNLRNIRDKLFFAPNPRDKRSGNSSHPLSPEKPFRERSSPVIAASKPERIFFRVRMVP